MRDRRPERPLRGPRRIDVDPLVVAGRSRRSRRSSPASPRPSRSGRVPRRSGHAGRSCPPPSYDARGPGVAGTGGEQEDQVAVARARRRGRRGRGRAAGRRRSCGPCRRGRRRARLDAERADDLLVHRALHVDPAEVRDVSSVAPERSSAPRAAATKFAGDTRRGRPSSPAGSATSRKWRRPATSACEAGSTEPPAGTFTWSEKEPSVSACEPSSTFGGVRAQQPRDGAVAEVEHEARAPVAVVEQVATRGRPRRGGRCAARAPRARKSRASRSATGVPQETLSYSIAYALLAAEPVRDPGRRLPDRDSPSTVEP